MTGVEWLAILTAFAIAGAITADRTPATRPAVRQATTRGAKAVGTTARKTWADRRAARRQAFAKWWAKTKPRQAAVKVVKVAGRGVSSVGALGRDVVVVLAVAGVAGAKEARDGWRTGREEYRKGKQDGQADSPDEKAPESADSTIPQPRTGEEPAVDSTPGQPGGQTGPQPAAGTSDAGTGPASEGSAVMTATTTGEQVDLTGVINWCDGAFASTDGSETVGFIQSGTQLYESFGGAIADIGGQVAEAATAEQETATAVRDALAAWGEAVLALKERCKAAIGG